MILILLSFILIFIGLVFLFMQQEKFGKKPKGERLETIKKSKHYKNLQILPSRIIFQKSTQKVNINTQISFKKFLKERQI